MLVIPLIVGLIPNNTRQSSICFLIPLNQGFTKDYDYDILTPMHNTISMANIVMPTLVTN